MVRGIYNTILGTTLVLILSACAPQKKEIEYIPSTQVHTVQQFERLPTTADVLEQVIKGINDSEEPHPQIKLKSEPKTEPNKICNADFSQFYNLKQGCIADLSGLVKQLDGIQKIKRINKIDEYQPEYSLDGLNSKLTHSKDGFVDCKEFDDGLYLGGLTKGNKGKEKSYWQRITKIFTDSDTNGDGVLSLEDDLNGDNQITLEDRPYKTANLDELKNRYDGDKDGKIDALELEGNYQTAPDETDFQVDTGRSLLLQNFKKFWDVNQNGYISNKDDLDGDGDITKNDAILYRDNGGEREVDSNYQSAPDSILIKG